MTRKDFILISSAIREAKERLLVKLPNDNPIRQAMCDSIELTALHIGKALLEEQGARFDFGRFLIDCGYGTAHRMPEGLAGDQPIPESHARGDYLDDTKPTEIYHCGICDHYHRGAWNGDCREDDERFTMDEVEDYFGNEGTGWVEVPLSGQQ